MELQAKKINSLSRKILINSIFNVMVASAVVGGLIFYGARRLSDKFLVLSEKQSAKTKQSLDEILQSNINTQNLIYDTLKNELVVKSLDKETLGRVIDQLKTKTQSEEKKNSDLKLSTFVEDNKNLATEIRSLGNFSLFEIYFLLGLGILMILDVVWGVSRGVTIRVTRPIMDLAEIAIKIAKGQYNHEITIKSDDEIGLLGEAFQNMSSAITKRDQELEAINKNLEKLVEQRTEQLNEQLILVSDLLNNMKQAVFSVSADRKVIVPVSRFAEELFEGSIVGKDIFDVVYSELEKTSESYSKTESALSLVFGESDLQWLMSEVELPKMTSISFKSGVKTLKISYNPLWDPQGDLVKLMYVIEDITDVLALEKKVGQEKLKSERNIQIIQEVTGVDFARVLNFLDAFGRQLAEIQSIKGERLFEKENIKMIQRNLHTIKGNARSLSLFLISSFIHNIETEFVEAIKLLDVDKNEEAKTKFHKKFEDLVNSVGDLRTEYTNLIDRTFKIRSGSVESIDTIEISKDKISKIKSWLLQEHNFSLEKSFDDLIGYCVNLLQIPAKNIFERNRAMVKEVSSRLGKQTELVLDCDELSLERDTLDLLSDGVGHLLRNSLDHAIEAPEVRRSKGKPDIGKIVIKGDRVENKVKIVISDDGRGIDPEFVLNRAIKNGIVAAEDSKKMSTEDKLGLIFMSGFSTKEEVSDISGRGIGMDAVKAIVTDLKGSIVVKSEIGVGTEIQIEFSDGPKNKMIESSQLKTA